MISSALLARFMHAVRSNSLVPLAAVCSLALSLSQCEKEGKASDYGASKPEGKNIHKYVLEYEEGLSTNSCMPARLFATRGRE